MAKKWLKLAGAFASGAMFMHMAKQARENNLKVHTWSSPALPVEAREVRLFFISDIHRRLLDDEMLDLIEGQCDVILVGGDLTEKWVPKSRTEMNLLKLTEIAPVFFVRGNNDNEVSQSWLMDVLASTGAVYLDDEAVELSINGALVRIIGLSQREYSSDTLDPLFDSSEDAYTLVLCHYPETSTFLHGKPIDAMLCGHTHGGQIRLFGYGPAEPGRLVREGGFMKLVSNGYGTTSLPLRLGAAPEAHLITIKPNKAKADE